MPVVINPVIAAVYIEKQKSRNESWLILNMRGRRSVFVQQVVNCVQHVCGVSDWYVCQ